jgi:hypothetical protein
MPTFTKWIALKAIIDQSPEQENEDFRNNESPLEENPLEPTLSRYADFFALFGDFRGYVTFFLLQDLVTDEFRVKFFMPFDDFRPPSAPKDIGTDKEYRRRSIEFIEARNHRIQRLDTAYVGCSAVPILPAIRSQAPLRRHQDEVLTTRAPHPPAGISDTPV